MKPTLEEIISKADMSQEKGIFYIPKDIKKRRVIRYFLKYAEKQPECPLVVLEEKYTRQSIIHKLSKKRCFNSNRNLVKAFLEYKLLRTPSNEEPDYQGAPIDNLSLAQVISYAYQVPIENVFLSKSYFSSSKFKSQNRKQKIKTLVNSYTGASWFERFKRKYKRRKRNQRFTTWHNIPLSDLPRLLCTSDYEPNDPAGNLTKLVMNNFIIPRDKFKRFSSRNFIDVYALIELASQVTGKCKEKLTNHDPYINYIARKFIYEKLIPHIRKTNLKLGENITLETARYRTGMDSDVLCRALKIKPNKAKRFYSKGTKIPAIDLALYELKNTHAQVFGKSDIARLFGMDDLDLERCNLHPNKNGTYNRIQRVFPFYDSVSIIVKEMLITSAKIPKPKVPLRFKDDVYYITSKTEKSYKKVYDIPRFDSTSIEHLRQCLSKGERVNGRIITPELILNIKNNEISSVQINTKNYISPVVN